MMKIALLLTFSSFCMGMAEFVASGILTDLSYHFGVSPGDVGSLATMYAIGVVIGAPIISVLVARFNYNAQLSGSLIIFCISNAIIYLNHDFVVVQIARFVGGMVHGLFFVIATIMIIRTSPTDKAGLFLSIMVSGLTIALVSGVPLGIYLSEVYGVMSPFLFISVVSGTIALISVMLVPRDMLGKETKLRNLLIAFKHESMCVGFCVTAMTCGAQFVLYVYLRLFLEGLGIVRMEAMFLAYGIAAVIGNLFGGKLVGLKGPFGALKIVLVGQIICFAMTSLTLHISIYAVAANMFLASFWGFASIAPLKMMIDRLAKRYTPHTYNDTIAVNEGSFNIGIAIASAVGGVVAELNVNFNGVFGSLFSLTALWMLVFFIKADFRRT